jgi:hypothetical protein
MIRRSAPILLALSLWLTPTGQLGIASAQTPTATQVPATPPGSVDRTTPASSLSDLPERAAATGYADVDALRALPWFAEVVRHQLTDMGVSARNAHQALTMLGHTHAAHASLVRGSGDLGIFATVVIHGEYTRNEVPTAVQGILPSILAALWHVTTIDGHRAYDMGVVVLLELTPTDWLLARRLRGALPVPGSTPNDALRALVTHGQTLGTGPGASSLAYGVLVGPDSVLPGQHPPTNLEDIFRGPSQALASFVQQGELLVVNWDVTLRHPSDSVAWETHYRSVISTLATRLHVPEASIHWTLTRTDTRLVARIELDHAAADAFVADLVGRALPRGVTSGTPPASAVGATGSP